MHAPDATRTPYGNIKITNDMIKRINQRRANKSAKTAAKQDAEYLRELRASRWANNF